MKLAYSHQQAGAQHRETPRMLLQAHHLQLSGDVGTTNADQALARSIAEAASGSDDLGTASPALLRWWAAHCEAQGRFGEAKAAYRRAGAWADLVRLACYEGVGEFCWCGMVVCGSQVSLAYMD